MHEADPFLDPLDLPVLGVPTRFLVTHPELADEVQEAFGAWERLPSDPDLRSLGRVRVRLHRRVRKGDGAAAPVTYDRPEPHRVLVKTPGSEGESDLATGEVVGWTTPELIADGAHFRHAFLSALTLAAVTVHDRVPLHAAAVARDDTALLLHGPSGVGKSSLVLAAALRGLMPLAEDVVYAELRRGPRLWGMPGPVHLSTEALRFFPGVEPLRSVVRTVGVTKHAVAIDRRAEPALVARRAGICLLQRSEGVPALEPIGESEVRSILAGTTEAGFDWYAEEAGDAAAFVCSQGAWRFQVGSDPHAAAEVLAEALDGIVKGS